jgi:hypothetical protein
MGGLYGSTGGGSLEGLELGFVPSSVILVRASVSRLSEEHRM